MSQNDTPDLINRRRALQFLGAGLSFGGLVLLGGCSKESAPAPAAPPPAPAAPPPTAAAGGLDCTTKAPIDDASAGLRRALQYVEKAADPNRACSKCVQFEAGKFGECGGCKLITGAINPEGSCLSFAPLAAAVPAPAAAPAPGAPGAEAPAPTGTP